MSERHERLKVSEIFESVQGEGPSLGARCVFLRLAGCNLHCHWCDTRYSWDWQRYRYDDEVTVHEVADLAAELRAAAGGRVVVTGGEPLIQQPALEGLLARLPASLTIEVETNGTFAPSAALAARVDQWNVSPKLASAGDAEPLRLDRDALAALQATGRAYLKFVVHSDADFREADALVAALAWPPGRVQFMPEAATRAELHARSLPVLGAAQARGYRFSTRLHVERWDGKRGV